MMMLPAQADVPICWASLWTLLFWWRALCSSYFHFIHLHFQPSSSTSISYILVPHHLFQFLVSFPFINSRNKFFCSLLLFWTSPLNLVYSSSSFLLILFWFQLVFFFFLFSFFLPQRILQFSSLKQENWAVSWRKEESDESPENEWNKLTRGLFLLIQRKCGGE